MNTNEKPGQRSRERIITGMSPEPVVMVKAPVVTPSCGPGKHCAAHCDAPHPCCRCGARFKPIEDAPQCTKNAECTRPDKHDGICFFF